MIAILPAPETVVLPTPSRAEIAQRLALALRSIGRHLAAARREHGQLGEVAVAGAIAATFQELGGTFTKYGQLVASSSSIFGDEVSHAFRGCFDAGPPEPFRSVASTLEVELGQPLDQLFASIDPRPMAAASLAVVHRATLLDGTPVAVKVLRPGIERRLATDLAVLRPLCDFIARQVAVGIAGVLPGLISGLSLQLTEELDLRNEVAASRWFAAVLDELDVHLVRTPHVYDHLSSQRVLTMELIDGVPVDDADAIAALGVDAGPLLLDCLRTWFAATLATGAFHGDIHAGNVLVEPSGTIALLDWGIVGRLDKETARFFRRLLEGAIGDESAWPEVAAHLEAMYGDGVRDALGLDEDGFVAFVRSQIEPMLRTPFGQIDMRTMLIGDGATDGKRAGERTTLESLRNWWEERRRQRAVMALEGYGGGFDQATFLLSKQLVYFERYGKRYLPDTPLLDDVDVYRALLADGAADGAAVS